MAEVAVAVVAERGFEFGGVAPAGDEVRVGVFTQELAQRSVKRTLHGVGDRFDVAHVESTDLVRRE